MNDVLNDIVIQRDDAEKEGSIFRHYVDKEIIAKEIFTKFKAYQRNGLFYLSDINRSSGIISILDGLKTLSLLFEMGVDCKQEEFVSLLNTNLNEMFIQLGYKADDPDALLNFNMTPFSKDVETPYVDTAAKVLSSIVEIREVLFAFDEDDESRKLISVADVGDAGDVLDALIIVIKKTINFLCRAAIKNPHPTSISFTKANGEGEPVNIELTHLGWNFTIFSEDKLSEEEKEKLEPSMFFTYSVSQAYMAIYESAATALKAFREGNKEKVRSELPPRLIKKFDRDYGLIEIINDEYGEFRKILQSVGFYIDQKIDAIDLRDLYLGTDWKSIDHTEIERSTTNNALFNTLYVVSILNNSGVFDIYNEYRPEERYLDYASSVINNVYDMYMDLVSSKKVYIVEQYVLNFNEFMPNAYLETANLLRKQRIQAITIVPLLVRTYALISAWVVQYPQKQMVEYLKLILTSRHVVKKTDKKEWIWDKEMYDVSINTIFIGALFDFYDYYETYEKPFISEEETIRKAQNDASETVRINKEETEAVLTQEREAAQQKLEEAQREIERVKQEQENLPIIVAIKNIVRDVLEKELINYLPDALNQARNLILKEGGNYNLAEVEKKEGAGALGDSFITLLSAYFAKSLLLNIDRDVGDNQKTYDELKSKGFEGLADSGIYREMLAKALPRLIDALTTKLGGN